ncbi:RtcB family protein [Pararhodobacter oceanensis]|uniref:RtcB family protein n=1 Tax=Pararhodobacter oceanensis TaxID=2172121 RepID=UPI003A93F2D8
MVMQDQSPKPEIVIMGEASEGALAQARNCRIEAEAMLLMADNHQGYGMPVGGVAVYTDRIAPAGVGFDIGCGNKAVRTDLTLADIKGRLALLADEMYAQLAFGVGQANKTRVEDALFDDPLWQTSPFLRASGDLKATARAQLGSIGAGNHYVNVFADEGERIWVGVHFGSRSLGHAIASHFMKQAGDKPNAMDAAPKTLPVKSALGRDYIACMQLAGRYAYAGRDWACDRVVEILGGEIVEEVHNHHNFAWHEEHDGQNYWVVRKGATPAFPGQRGFVGASMGGVSVILQGVDSAQSRGLYYSTVHGAGRVMSRSAAAGRRRRVKRQATRKDGRVVNVTEWVQSGGQVDFPSVQKELARQGIILRGSGADEAPEVYKDLDKVLEAHAGTVEVLHRLRPLIVCMAA